MKTIKEGLFWFVIFYVVIVSFLLIRQSFIVHDTMYKEVKLEENVEYEKFIVESKNELAKYRNLSTTEEQLSCLNEVEKAINVSYKNQHANITNYKEAKKYFYNIPEEEKYYNYINIEKTCDINTDSNSLAKAIMANIVLVEKEIIKTNYIYMLTFPDSFLFPIDIVLPVMDDLSLKTETDTRSMIINNDKKYISEILEKVGEKYESE